MSVQRRTLDRTNVTLRPLRPEDDDACAAFWCGDGDLDDFVRTDAFRLQQENIVRTYLAWQDGTLAGYVSLLADAIVLETRERKKLHLTFDDHPVIPALKIARLAVAEHVRTTVRGTGELLVAYAFLRALATADVIGCRLLTLDAYPASVGFYERLGFVPNRAKIYQGRAQPSMRLDVFAPTPPSWVTAASFS